MASGTAAGAAGADGRGRAPGPGSRAIRRGWRALLVGGIMVALGAVVALAAAWATLRDLPLARMLPPLGAPSLEIVTGDGRVLAARGPVRAAFVGLDGFPPHLVEAVIAVEDRRFRQHGGVDLRGVARAALRNAGAGGVVEGGSTITQQLVKILYLDAERSLRRKLQEAALATAVERQLGKDRVLELYLNAVYLGSGAYGMPAAARTYFGKAVGELDLAESALLAASIQLPSEVNPLVGLGSTQNRAALVLGLMAEQGRIGAAEREAAVLRLATLAPTPPPERAGSYFADWVAREVEGYGPEAATGLTATVTLDPALQAEAERVLRDVIATQGPEAGATQAALVAMTPDGRVRAMVGGVDYAQSQFNRAADARRQPGSAFKLFVYMAALGLGARPDDRLSDQPVEIDGWTPQNFDGRSHGIVTMREAFAQSYNVATARLAAEVVGLDAVAAAARELGIEAELSEVPALALGASEVTLLDLTEAYAGLARGRAPVMATGLSSMRFDDGAALAVSGRAGVRTVRFNRTRDPMLEMLRAVVTEGTGRAAAIEGVEVAGKTGTSQDSRDAWFVGFTEDLVIGVWVGNDDDSPMNDVTGGGLPAEIWRRVMESTIEEEDVEEAAAGGQEAAPLLCNVASCAAAYTSFRASDCTYQPFEGPRQVCTR